MNCICPLRTILVRGDALARGSRPRSAACEWLVQAVALVLALPPVGGMLSCAGR